MKEYTNKRFAIFIAGCGMLPLFVMFLFIAQHTFSEFLRDFSDNILVFNIWFSLSVLALIWALFLYKQKIMVDENRIIFKGIFGKESIIEFNSIAKVIYYEPTGGLDVPTLSGMRIYSNEGRKIDITGFTKSYEELFTYIFSHCPDLIEVETPFQFIFRRRHTFIHKNSIELQQRPEI